MAERSQYLADALKRDPARFNARFQTAVATMPRLDGERFAQFLREHVAPIAEAVGTSEPDRVFPVVDQLYRVALQVVGREMPERYPAIDDLWACLADLAVPFAADPRAAAMAINVCCNVADVPGGRPQQLIDDLRRIAPHIETGETLRQVLAILAWRAGYSQARLAALSAARELPPHVAVRCLLPAEHTPETIAETVSVPNILDHLAGDPWTRPEGYLTQYGPPRAPRIASRAGGFRGFAGPFLRPPTVARHDGHFVLTDGFSWWALATDIFGTTLRRLDTAPTSPVQAPEPRWLVTPDGQVAHGVERFQVEALSNPTSWAADESTLVITTGLSHKAYVVGWLPVED